MDITTALRPDAYRIVLINLVPGATALAPWMGFIIWPDIMTAEFWALDGIAFPVSVSLFMAILVVGLLCENAGSAVEIYWGDRWLSEKAPYLSGYWWCYLALKKDAECIATGYLRAILLRFKFELAMIPAAISAALGLAFAYTSAATAEAWVPVLSIMLFLLALWLLLEVRFGVVLLARLRKVVVDSNARGPETLCEFPRPNCE